MRVRNKWIITLGIGICLLGLVVWNGVITSPLEDIDTLDSKIFALGAQSEELSENTLKNKYLPCLASMKNTFPSSSSDEKKLYNLAGECHIFSNALTNFTRRSIKQKQYAKVRTLVLQISGEVARLVQKVYDIMPDENVPVAISTPWLSVTYNDNYLNILDIINSITFDNTYNSIKNIQPMLDKIVARLDEETDPNIYVNIVEEIEFNNTELIKMFFYKLSQVGCYETRTIKTFSSATQKFINHVKTYVVESN